MTFRHLFLSCSLFLLLPLGVTAAEAGGSTAPAIPAVSAEAVDCSPAVEGLFETALEAAEPAYKSCTYTCTLPLMCPSFINTPPAACVNGCCVYEESCETTCNFDDDCGEQASCWSGCCYFWNRPN